MRNLGLLAEELAAEGTPMGIPTCIVCYKQGNVDEPGYSHTLIIGNEDFALGVCQVFHCGDCLPEAAVDKFKQIGHDMWMEARELQ